MNDLPAVLDRYLIFSAYRLKTTREMRGMTQQATADALGVHIRHYQKIEAAEVNPTSLQLGIFSGLFGVTIDSLYAIPEGDSAV